MATVVDNKFEIGDFVYLKTDPDQEKRVITGIMIRPVGIVYYAACCERETPHFEFELSADKDILIKSSE